MTSSYSSTIWFCFNLSVKAGTFLGRSVSKLHKHSEELNGRLCVAILLCMMRSSEIAS